MATKTCTIPRATITEALDLANIYDYTIRDYRGRGMSRLCFGIVLDSSDELYRFLMALGALLTEKALWTDESDPDPTSGATDLAGSVAVDGMGTGLIVYFPGWSFEEES